MPRKSTTKVEKDSKKTSTAAKKPAAAKKTTTATKAKAKSTTTAAKAKKAAPKKATAATTTKTKKAATTSTTKTKAKTEAATKKKSAATTAAKKTTTASKIAKPKSASTTKAATKPKKASTTTTAKKASSVKVKKKEEVVTESVAFVGTTPIEDLPAKPISYGDIVIQPYPIKPREEYMCNQQKEHFIEILLAWKKALMEEVDRTMDLLQGEVKNLPDITDRASQDEEFSVALRTRDRERKLIKKIDSTLARIRKDDYGFCDSCGIEIGIRRLEARPTANLCIDCKTLDEIVEKQTRG